MLGLLGVKQLGPKDPAEVGGYRLLGLLGKGGMGRVYLAADSVTGALVAVKVIRPDLAEETDFRRRFSRELAVVAHVRTPYAPALVNGEADTDQPWMATEFVPGVSLSEALGSGQPLPASAVWRLAHDLASALVTVHQAGLVHRDIKPSNVILSSTGAKLIDFGVARSPDLSMTATGIQLGSPEYMAPEQARGEEISSASDIFSLGALLSYVATGKRPYGSGEIAAVLFRVAYQEPDLSGLDDLEPDIRNLLLRCMDSTPLRRPNAAGVLTRARAAAAAGAFPEDPAAAWPDALASRILTRAEAAAGTLSTSAAHRSPMQPDGSIPPPPIPLADSVPTMFIQPTAPQAGTEQRHGRRRGILIAAISTAAVIGLAAAAPLLLSDSGSDQALDGAGRVGSPLSSATPSTAPNTPSASADAGVAFAGGASPSQASTAPSSPAGPAAVVEAYYAAINAHDYRTAWNLGGKNLSHDFQAFENGFSATVRDVVAPGAVSGSTISVSVTATHTDGTRPPLWARIRSPPE